MAALMAVAPLMGTSTRGLSRTEKNQETQTRDTECQCLEVSD